MATDRSYVTENQTQLARLEALVSKLGDQELSRPLEAGWHGGGRARPPWRFWDYRIVTLWRPGRRRARDTTAPLQRDLVDWINDAASRSAWGCRRGSPPA